MPPTKLRTQSSTRSQYLKRIESAKEVWAQQGWSGVIRAAIQGAKRRWSKYYSLVMDSLCDWYSRGWVLLTQAPLRHVIGDSHSLVFKRQPGFIVHHVGPATAHNLIKDTSATQSGRQLREILGGIRKRDVVIFCFGEIDCRIHIYYQFRKNEGRIPISELIRQTIWNYGSVLSQVVAQGFSVCVYGIPPPGHEENRYGYPFYATLDMRSTIYKEFNECLKKLCADKGIKYIDIFSLVSDEHGGIAAEYADGQVHLNSRVVGLVREWFVQEYQLDM